MLFLATIMCICTLGTTVLAADEKVSTTEYDFEVTPDMVENGVVTLSTAAVDNTFNVTGSHTGSTRTYRGNTLRYQITITDTNGRAVDNIMAVRLYKSNGTQIHLWNSVMNGITQTFSFTKTLNNTYIIWTKASNYTKVASLSDNLCSDGINVHQWEYSNHSHDQWIFEPVYKFENMGVAYAKANYNRKVDA